MRFWNKIKGLWKTRPKRHEDVSFPGAKPGKKESIWLRLLIPFVLGLIIIFLFPTGRAVHYSDLAVGSISSQRIIAPFNFEILKTQAEYGQDREQAVQNLNPVFIKDPEEPAKMSSQILRFFDEMGEVRKKASELPPNRHPQLLDSVKNAFPILTLAREDWQALLNRESIFTDGKYKDFVDQILQVVRNVSSVGILNRNLAALNPTDRRLIVKSQDEEVYLEIDLFYDLDEARKRVLELLQARYEAESSQPQIGSAIISYYLRPNLLYDDVINQARIADAQSRVPLSSGFVYENELIVDRNQRITPEIRKKLDSLSSKMIEKGMVEGGIQRIFPILGKIAFIYSLIFLLAVYLRMEKSKLLNDLRSILLLALIFLIIALAAFLVHRLQASAYFVPTALGAMLLASIFDTRIAFAGTAILSVLVGALWGNEFNLMAVSFFTGVIGILVIKRVRTRGQLVQAVFYMVAAQIVTITMMGFLRFLPFSQILHSWQFGALNGLFTPIVAYGLLALIESLFGITTDFALLELSNLNHPLLKRLSVEAPGTYHHSILVGNMAEAAAQAIGANSLLARVGCYYHDIGKLEKAEYFVENQIGMENPHNKLAPSMSALILINHVKKGMDLAEKYKLPKAIRDIMAQHHGKTTMTFFYQKALAKSTAEEVNDTEYRYPGPLPQSKEAAIVMLADAIEATSRSLKEATHSRLKGVIEDIVDGRFQAGELDQSPLTLRDLERIKESFLTILAGTFHARIEYPEKDESKAKRSK